jgi:hypothetical protein
VWESASAPTNYCTPVFFCPRYSEHADDKVEPEDVPKGKDLDAVTAGERELDSDPEGRPKSRIKDSMKSRWIMRHRQN